MEPVTPSQPTALAVRRRTFLDTLLATSVASSAVAAFYPLMRFLVPPAGGEPTTASVVAGRLADMKVNSGVLFPFGNRPAILVRTPEGEFKAFSAVCTHLECTVQYKGDSSQIWCACHNGFYDLGGNVVSGPPPRPLESYAVAVRGEPGKEEVIVSRG
jgi:cytochrome b6-f complex iron-sulfur subunit